MSGMLNNPEQGNTKNLFLAFVLAAGVLVVWQSFMVPPPPPPGEVTPETVEDDVEPVVVENIVVEGSGEAPAAVPEAEPLPPQILAGANHTLTVSNIGARLVSVTIDRPEQYIPHDEIRGVFPEADEDELPLALDIDGLPDLQATSVFTLVEEESERGDGDTYRSVTYRWTSPDGQIRIEKRVAIDDELPAFGASFEVTVENLGAATRRFGGLDVLIPGFFSTEGGGMLDRAGSILEGICAGGFGVERRPARKIEEHREYGGIEGLVDFAGVDERYFITAVAPAGDSAADFDRCSFDPVDVDHVVTTLSSQEFDVAPGPDGAAHFSFVLYTGPKNENYLSAHPGALERSIDFGWFSFLAVPIRFLLLLFQGWVVNWGLAVILLTVFVKIVLFPITQRGYESMEKMKRVQPELKKLQKKYEHDKMKLAEEQMALFKREGANPMSGCLPMVLQMPIYIALYRAIWGSAELYNADFALWVHDLSQPDPYFVLPIAMGLVMFFQQRLMPQQTDNPQMQMVTRIMPVMFTVMMLFLPSGLVLYIFVNMLLSILQMLYIRRKFGTTPEPAKA